MHTPFLTLGMEPSYLSGFSPFLVSDAPSGASSSAAFACVLCAQAGCCLSFSHSLSKEL